MNRTTDSTPVADQSSDSRRPILVTAAILEKGGLVLAARRGPGKHLAGLWEFPGGKVEKGESPRHCLERELHEELGITARAGAFVGQNTHDYGDRIVRLLAYRVEHLAGDFQTHDHDELTWLAPEALSDLAWAPADIPLVEQFLALHGTQSFYTREASAYCEESRDFVVPEAQERFLSYVAPGGHILDAGCGSGRDARIFAERGYCVTAMDCNPALASLAAAFTGLEVVVLSVLDLEVSEGYDGVWACASLLHLPAALLDEALERLGQSLRRGGVFYMSFKEGDASAVDERGRFFNNLTVAALRETLSRHPSLVPMDIWRSTSPLRGHSQPWSNALVRRV